MYLLLPRFRGEMHNRTRINNDASPLRNYRAEFSWIMELSLIDGRRLKEDDIEEERERERERSWSAPWNESTLEQWKLTTNDSKDSFDIDKEALRRGGKEAKDVRFAHGFHFVRSWLTERWNLISTSATSQERRESIKSSPLVFQWFL